MFLTILFFSFFASGKPADATWGIKPPPPPVKELFMIGHLLTPAVSTVPKDTWAVGTTALGYGFNDRFMVATSPWLMGYYNLTNLVLRYRQPIDSDRFWGAQLAYFKNNDSFGKIYKMEAVGLWALYRVRINAAYRCVFSLNYFNFLDDTVPFSLRRWNLNNPKDKSQFTMTTLNEIGMTNQLRFFIEFGLLGLNYQIPNYHFGASLAYRWSESAYAQLGLSATGYISNITRSAYNQVYQTLSQDSASTVDFNSVYRNSVAVHPEVQIQFQF